MGVAHALRTAVPDGEDPVILARLAASSDINTDEFRARFQSIVGYEPPSLNLPIS